MSAPQCSEQTPQAKLLAQSVVTEDEVKKLITDTFNGLPISEHVLTTIKGLVELFVKPEDNKADTPAMKWLLDHVDTLKEHISDIVLYQPQKDVYLGPCAEEFKKWRIERGIDLSSIAPQNETPDVPSTQSQ